MIFLRLSFFFIVAGTILNSFPLYSQSNFCTRTEYQVQFSQDKDLKYLKNKAHKSKIAYARIVNGLIVERGEFQSTAGMVMVTCFEHDPKGNTTKEIYKQYYNNRPVKQLGWKKNMFDDQNRLFCEVWYNPDSTEKKMIIYEYDQEGKLVEKTDSDGRSLMYDSQGRPLEIFLYDQSGRITDYRKYNKGDELAWHEHYFYTPSIKTTLHYDAADKLFSISEFEGSVNKPIRYFYKEISSPVETRDVYIYDRSSLLKKILHYDRDQLNGYTLYNYK